MLVERTSMSLRLAVLLSSILAAQGAFLHMSYISPRMYMPERLPDFHHCFFPCSGHNTSTCLLSAQVPEWTRQAVRPEVDCSRGAFRPIIKHFLLFQRAFKYSVAHSGFVRFGPPLSGCFSCAIPLCSSLPSSARAQRPLRKTLNVV